MARGSDSPSSPSTPATKRRPCMPGPAGLGMRRSPRSRASRVSTGRRRSSGRRFVDVTEGGQEASPRCAAVDGRGRDLQERDLSLPAPVERRPTRKSPRAQDVRRATCTCRAAPRPSGSSSSSAEQLVTVKTKRGFSRLEWQKLRERNEALDCRVYARAAAWIAGADRWTEAKWRDLEQQVGPAPDEAGGRRREDKTNRSDGGHALLARRARPASAGRATGSP